MESIAIIVTAISTGTLAIIGVVQLVHPVVSRALRARAMKRLERSPLDRVQIVNVKRYGNSDVMTILVRNRSHVAVGLYNPVFEIRGVRSTLPGSMVPNVKLHPGETKEFQMKFDGSVADASPDECSLVDLGQIPGA